MTTLSPISILVVEDEQHSRDELCFLLSRLAPQAHVESADHALAAWARLEAGPDVDLVFLDIQMPGMSGLELAARLPRLPRPPRVVFATANPGHALAAYDLDGVDYLLKPYRESRLARTLARVAQLGPPASAPVPSPTAVSSPIAAPKLWATRGEVQVLLAPADVLYCRAQGNTVYVATGALGPLPLRQTLQELEERFAAGPFLRVHKSYLVNLDHVREIEPYFSGNFRLRLSDGARVPLSRRYARAFRERLGLRPAPG